MPKASARTLVLRPADPFDLIRWLARSQSDPRKAVAELVQNSIDALPSVAGGAGGDAVPDGRGAPEPLDPEETVPSEPELFPAGALTTVSIAPDPVEVAPGHEHRARADARDGDGRPIRQGVTYRWSIEGQASPCAEKDCARR